MNKLQGKIQPLPKISGSIGAKTINIGGKPYEGEYVVTPKTSEQTLETRGSFMEDDVRIKSIPFFCVSNQSGGNTAYIGSEV